MKDFLKFTLATIVGIIISTIIITFIFIGIITAVVSSTKDKEVTVKPNSVLHIKLQNAITDRSSKNPFDNFNFQTMKAEPKLGLDDILKNIKKAKTDDKIKGIYLDITYIPAGIATTEEIRNALLDFKESGKFIISYSDAYTQIAYYFATVSDKIYLNPEGLLEFKGLRAELMFFKGSFEKLGIVPQVIRHGKFKSAIEPFTLDKMSDENREQIITYVNSIWNNILEEISKQRNISIEQLNYLADNKVIINPETAFEHKMIDGIKYKDEILAELKELLKIDEKKDIRFISLSKYTNAPKKRKHKGLAKDKIAVVFASGMINIGEGDEESIGSDRISKAIRKARLDKSIKAVVLRVNSGGGSATASDIILREVALTAQVKPVIASMGDVAASGGYYIACAADTIVASPNTITGSIGAVGIFFNAKKFLDEKLGITVDRVNTNAYSDFPSFTRPIKKAEKEIIQNYIEKVYDVFISHVAEGRNMTKAQVDSIGQGRVWSGVNAKEIGLIDVFGGLETAINIAAEKANLEHYRIVSLPIQEDPFVQLVKQITGEVQSSFWKNNLGEGYRYYNNLQKALKMKGVQAIMPFEIDIY